MKIKMVRQSGNAVLPEQLAKFELEFKDRYDKIIEEFGNDMKIVHEKLDLLDIELSLKYDAIHEIDLPKSGKQQKALVETFGQYMVTTHIGTGELIYVILDMGV